MHAQIDETARLLGDILATRDTLTDDTAQVVADFVSELISLKSSTDEAALAPAEASAVTVASRRATASIVSAVTELARAASAPTEGGTVVELHSANLNVTTEVRPATDVATRPVRCATAQERAEVAMPTDVLHAVEDLNTSLPVAVIMYTLPNLHSKTASLPNATLQDDDANETAVPLGTSNVVSFSLMQSGKHLRIQRTAQPINISIPYYSATKRTLTGRNGSVCVGQSPDTMGAKSCTSIIECRWWNTTGGTAGLGDWSSAGCMTLAADTGEGYVCSCDHLTDFIVFEFPTSTQELLDDIREAVSINVFSAAALECIATPYPRKIWPVWVIDLSILLLGGLALASASRRDEEEVQLVEMLVKGRQLERRQRLLRLVHVVSGVGRAKGGKEQAATFASMAPAATGSRTMVPSEEGGRGPRWRSTGRIMPAGKGHRHARPLSPRDGRPSRSRVVNPSPLDGHPPPSAPPSPPPIPIPAPVDVGEDEDRIPWLQETNSSTRRGPILQRTPGSSRCRLISTRPPSSTRPKPLRASSSGTFTPLPGEDDPFECLEALADAPDVPPQPRSVSSLGNRLVSARATVLSAMRDRLGGQRKENRWRVALATPRAQQLWKVARRQKRHVLLALRW